MSDRLRNWTFLLYPDSAGDLELIQQKLYDLSVPCLISPLHVPDEQEKKPHYHVVLFFSSVKTYRQVLATVQGVFGTVDFKGKECHVVNTVEKVYDKGGIIRYLVHYGIPDKQQFNELSPEQYITRVNYPFQLKKYFCTEEIDGDLIDVLRSIDDHIEITRKKGSVYQIHESYTFRYYVQFAIDNNQYKYFNTLKTYRAFIVDYLRSAEYLMGLIKKEENSHDED